MSGEVSHHAGITSLSMRMDRGVAADICAAAIRKNAHSPVHNGNYPLVRLLLGKTREVK